ncbi:MAG TPA: hypothetical protein DDZ80_10150 [Cyanobacteria bacterium UBA8803]|nr:hypothetical protein [Cyanobacteria bacterium UBA9273]HBL58853.1 hypothetical protein [Cyanobacteria bacterium UBA8803]
MPNSPHRIRRLRWQVTTSTVGEAFAIRKYLHDEWLPLLQSAFEKAFDAAANGETLIHIRKIELRLKVSPEQELSEVVPDLIAQQLREQLQTLLQPDFSGNGKAVSGQESTIQQNQFDILLYYLGTGTIPWQVAYAPTSTIAAELKETCRQQLPELLHYLQNKEESRTFYFRWLQLIPEEELLTWVSTITSQISHSWKTALGQFLSWWLGSDTQIFNRYTQLQVVAAVLSASLARGESNVNLNLRAIIESVLSRQEQQKLNDLMASEPAAMAMLFLHQEITGRASAEELPESSIAEITEAREQIDWDREEKRSLLDDSPLANTPPNRLIPEINQVNQETRSPLNFASQFPQDSSDSTMSEMPEIGEETLSNPAERRSPLNADSQLANASPDMPMPEINRVNQERRSPLDPDSQLGEDLPDSLVSGRNDREGTNQLFDHEIAPLNIDTDSRIFDREVLPAALAIAPNPAEFPIAVKYGGLVLIHPFITRFLENTGVKETGNAQLSSFTLAQAAALLHFLATGCAEIYEYELGFIKILLGCPPEIPLLIAPGLIKPSDRAEAEALLQSVITYWSILKNTSIQGLRSSFLQRQGWLRPVESGWQLQLESQPFDLLLNHLPWSISIIKLPWMKKPIYTEWQMP